MQVAVIKATIEQKHVVTNLLELYAYDFTEFYDFDISPDSFYGYERLPLYWTEIPRLCVVFDLMYVKLANDLFHLSQSLHHYQGTLCLHDVNSISVSLASFIMLIMIGQAQHSDKTYILKKSPYHHSLEWVRLW